MIIAAYAGVGKSTFVAINGESALDFHCLPYKYYLDKDSYQSEAGKANPDNIMRLEWPNNYVSGIKNMIGSYKYILIPSDYSVLALLKREQIPYILVYPCRDAREEYLRRYVDRGNTENFTSIFYGDWDWFMDNLESDVYGNHIVLQPYQFLSDVVDILDNIK